VRPCNLPDSRSLQPTEEVWREWATVEPDLIQKSF
jgi:hypothetical protein